jgi:hypothetical protein
MKTLPLLCLLAACSSAAELPDGWEGARSLDLAQAACTPAVGPGLPRMALSTSTNGVVTATVQTAGRCSASMCGYLIESASATRVLLQPCEMHPQTVTKCACSAEVTFTLPPSAPPAAALQVWWRPDFYGLTRPNQPQLVPPR